jgi:hypothetical protein
MRPSKRANKRASQTTTKPHSRTSQALMPLGTPTYSLEELEGEIWGEPEFFSGLVLRCHELRKKPLSDLDPSDLRILIAQQIGLPFLMPLALQVLEREPLLDAECYEGDLLSSLIQVDPRDFQAHPEWLARSQPIVVRALAALEGNDEMDLARSLNAFLSRFESRHGR